MGLEHKDNNYLVKYSALSFLLQWPICQSGEHKGFDKFYKNSHVSLSPDPSVWVGDG